LIKTSGYQVWPREVEEVLAAHPSVQEVGVAGVPDLHALPEDIAKYEGTYDDGWQAIRNARYARQLEMGLFDATNTPLPTTQGNDWNGLTAAQRLFLSNAMQTHAAMVDRVDQTVGDLILALKANGQFENTLIIFMSDNGASAEVYLNPGYDRPSETREGVTLEYCGGQTACPHEQPGDETTWDYLAQSWANAANTPFRYWKGTSFRGGNTTPFIMHWPRGLGVEGGAISEQAGHAIDILPTILEITGVEYPDSYMGNALTTIDGKSLLPIMQGMVREPHERIFFEHQGTDALIEGDYKIVRGSGGDDPWELYNITQDRTETNDLAGSDAARVTSMGSAWANWYASVPH
jgi:arylsulfatase